MEPFGPISMIGLVRISGRAAAWRLKVSLRPISPMIWRRVPAPRDLTLYGLHRTIQIAFGREDYQPP